MAVAEAQRLLGAASREQAGEGRAEILLVRLQPVTPCELTRSRKVRSGGFDDTEEMAGVGDDLLALSEGQASFEPAFQRRRPQLLEADRIRLSPAGVGDVSQRRPAPASQAPAEDLSRGAGIPGPKQLAAGGDVVLEENDVEFVRFDSQLTAAVSVGEAVS